MHARVLTVTTLVALVFTFAPPTANALDAAPKCESGKLKTAGKYAACRLGAESKAVKKGEAPDYTKCEEKFSLKWQSTESKAAGACPTNADESSMDTLITDQANEVAALLAGGSPGYVDCGNGTVADPATGLVWQKTDDAGGVTDKDNTYSWSFSFDEPNGTAFTSFLALLNESFPGSCPSGGPTGGCCPNAECEELACYAGHCDWRLPTVVELRTILLEPYPCGTTPCIDESVFGPTASSFYWSASAGFDPIFAWFVGFSSGFVNNDFKNNNFHVRAVRSGSCP